MQIVPVMHWTLININNPAEVSLFLYRVVVLYLGFILAAAFYVSLIPERIFPGAMMQ